MIIEIRGNDLGSMISQLLQRLRISCDCPNIMTIFQGDFCNDAASVATCTNYCDLHSWPSDYRGYRSLTSDRNVYGLPQSNKQIP